MKQCGVITYLLFCIVTILAAQNTITFSLVGDIMPANIYNGCAVPKSQGILLFKDATPIFSQSDFTLGNLETTLADSGVPRNQEREYMFLTPVSYGKVLKEAGIDFLSLANNHSLDFGVEGVASTIKVLTDNNILFSGLRRQKPFVTVTIKGIKVAICAFGFNYYCNHINKKSEVKRIITQAKDNADIVVVSFHGGAEGSYYRNLPNDEETFLGENRGDLRSFAHFCIDNGADIVYGHGPHVVRAVEVYNNRFIAYSLGNFCTPYGVSIKGVNGYAPIINVTVAANGEFSCGRIYSLRQLRGLGPKLDNQDCALKEIRLLSDDNIANGALNITSTGHILPTHKTITGSDAEQVIEENYDEQDIDWSKTGW